MTAATKRRYDWFHQFFQAGKEIAAAVKGWRDNFTDHELKEFDGDLVRREKLQQGVELLVKQGIRALIQLSSGDEGYARRVTEMALSDAIAPSNAAFSVFGLVRIEQARRRLEALRKMRAQTQGTLDYYCQHIGEIEAMLEEIQVFARGESPQGYVVIADFKAFVRNHATFDHLIGLLDADAGTIQLGLNEKQFGLLRAWALGTDRLTLDQAAQQKGFASAGERDELIGTLDLKQEGVSKTFFAWSNKDGTRAGLLKLLGRDE